MKKITLYLAILLTAVLSSCSQKALDEKTPAEFTGIRLEPVCTELNTKATVPGDDTYNENAIKSFLYFIYSDEAGTTLVTSGTSSDGEPVDILLDNYITSFTDNKGYVYVIANLPASTDLPDSPTVENLKEIALSSSFYTGDARNGKVNLDNRFVMVSEEPQEFSLTAKVPTDVKAQIKRVASKITFTLDVVKQLQQMVTAPDGTYSHIKTWDAVIDSLQIYLLWAAKDGTISGVPLTYSDGSDGSDDTSGSFYSTPRYAMFTTGTAQGCVPDTAYTSITKETTVSEWNEETKAMELVTKERACFELTSIPLYSYPISWNFRDAHAPFIKIILPWRATTPNQGTDDKATEFYYKILIPEETELVSNTCYKITLDLAVLGSEADDVPVEVTGKYYAVDWNEAEEMGGDVHAGQYLKMNNTFEMYGNKLDIPFSASGPVVISAFESTTGNPSGTYPLLTGSGNPQGTLNYHATDSTGTNFTVSANNDGKYVRVWHNIVPFSTSFSSSNAKDIAVITYKFRVSLSGHSDLYQDVTVTQYPSIYAKRQTSRGNTFVNNTRGTSGGASVNNNNRYSLGQVTNRAGNRSTNLTIVSISTLSGLATTYPDWVIGDPRIRLGNAYNGTYSNEQSYHTTYQTDNNNNDYQWRRSDLGSAQNYYDEYLVGDINASNVIAPRFMLASGYGYNGGASSSSTWKSYSERCATYQEDGYPAGRWRVPTEAELTFCAILAVKTLIENPYVNNTNYLASSGRFLQYSSNSNWTFNVSPNTTRSIRCVYDLWYWGDDPVDGVNGTYTVMLPE